ncbi:nuclear transport factor 2 family protein [Nonomuraea sp. NPDC052265]|uniref:nuclear transport factor 2 family protein n=1 Tax=Nonomuraea sp. NPDC052265 TaxID=3364374 RepID=UPI0037C9569E
MGPGGRPWARAVALRCRGLLSRPRSRANTTRAPCTCTGRPAGRSNAPARSSVAFAHMLHRDSGKRRNGLQTSIWVRSSLGFRRAGGRWLITHEHVSVPIDPRTPQAWLPPEG